MVHLGRPLVALSGLLLLAAPAGAVASVSGQGGTLPAIAYAHWCADSHLCGYLPVGSGAGLAALANRVSDFAASDAPPSGAQLAAIEATGGGVAPLYFPTLLAAITVPTNIPGVGGRLRLDGDTLGRIFDGDITDWNDPAIKKTNPGVALPSTPITVCVRSDASGTSFGFSRYLTKVSPSFKAKVNFSQTPPWTAPNLSSAQGNPGVAECVQDKPNSIGYVDLPDARATGLAPKATAVGRRSLNRVRVLRAGRVRTVTTPITTYVVPTPQSVSAAGNLARIPGDLLVDTSASPAPGAYPISVATWIVTFGRYQGLGKDPEGVRAMLDYVYSPAAQAALPGLGFAPLPKPLLAAARRQVARVR